MLRAAAMLIGLFFLWLAMTQLWESGSVLIVAGVVVFSCVGVAARLGGLGGQFVRAPRTLLSVVARVRHQIAGAVDAVLAACAPRKSVEPGLIRVRTQLQAGSLALLCGFVSGIPGIVVVEADGDGLLLHVMKEKTRNTAWLAQQEQLAAAGAGAEF